MKPEKIRFGVGPMSRNVVDAVIEFCKEKALEDVFCFIPSYRQIDTPSGYVNDWSTCAFVKYVRARSSIAIMRDHAGVNQGSLNDSWWQSLQADLNVGLDAIHVDPWKEMHDPPVGLAAMITAAIIRYCHSRDPGLFFEIGTEQAIRDYSPCDLEHFLNLVKACITPVHWERVKWVVVQSGSHVFDLSNSGNEGFESSICKELVEICKQFGKQAKEHNSDFLITQSIYARYQLGVDAFNVAPELGTIETRVILDQLQEYSLDSEKSELINKCVQSDRWKRWIAPTQNGAHCFVLACGHYHFKDPWFIRIYEALRARCDIDTTIRAKVKERLQELVWATDKR